MLARVGLALALLCHLPWAAQGGAPTMWLQGVASFDPLAVCNDGTPAGFYFINATTQPDVFLLYLEGGMCAWAPVD